jgi:hypothetical protein
MMWRMRRRAQIPTYQRLREETLPQFLAKMLAVGICGDEIAGLARDSFDEALQEKSRSLMMDSPNMVLTWFKYAGIKLTFISGESRCGLSPSGWLSLQKRLAELTNSDDGEVALLAMEANLKMYECVWQTANPMRPARNEREDQQAHLTFLAKFCDRFPELARPRWKELAQHQHVRGNQ